MRLATAVLATVVSAPTLVWALANSAWPAAFATSPVLRRYYNSIIIAHDAGSMYTHALKTWIDTEFQR